jgi:hypothetical protein
MKFGVVLAVDGVPLALTLLIVEGPEGGVKSPATGVIGIATHFLHLRIKLDTHSPRLF